MKVLKEWPAVLLSAVITVIILPMISVLVLVMFGYWFWLIRSPRLTKLRINKIIPIEVSGVLAAALAGVLSGLATIRAYDLVIPGEFSSSSWGAVLQVAASVAVFVMAYVTAPRVVGCYPSNQASSDDDIW